MHYIVDARVVAEYLVTGTYTSQATAFFRGAFTGDLFTVPEIDTYQPVQLSSS